MTSEKVEFDPTDLGPEWRCMDLLEPHNEIEMNYFSFQGNPVCFNFFEGYPIFANVGAAVTLLQAFVDQRLEKGYVKGFKVGITSDILRRWDHDPSLQDALRGYKQMGFHQMNVLLSARQTGVVGTIETRLLDKYRTYDYERKVNRQKGDHRCLNQRKGGENADFGQGPYFVYVVWQFNPGALELAMRRAR